VSTWHILTSEYPPDVGGVSDYTRQVAEGLASAGDEVHVWCPHSSSARVAGVHVHAELGGIRPADLDRLASRLDEFGAPRRLLVQWVPHGFGYHSMNVWFCMWLAKRAWRGDEVELVVHEPYLEFRRGPLRHALMACVHRIMTVVLLAASRRVWISIPAWEAALRPYAFGRRVPIDWLPVPSCVASPPMPATEALRRRYTLDAQPLVGHFGSYGPAISRLLAECLPDILSSPSEPAVLLLGAGSSEFRQTLIERHPSWSARIHAAGYVTPEDLAALVTVCDVFVQPYPDGVSSRRTSVMACLSQGRAVVTTRGHLTEPLWAETGAVVLTALDDPGALASGVVHLLDDPVARLTVASRGRAVYTQRFSIHLVVDALRAA
jgi:glycosyltransferase involved in cell wall biosynthesis